MSERDQAAAGAEVTPLGLIRAIHDLHDRRGSWPTQPEIAAHLNVTQQDVHGPLRELEQAHVFQGRRRGGQIRWMPPEGRTMPDHDAYPNDAVRAALSDPALEHLRDGPARELLRWLAGQTHVYGAKYRLVVERVDG